MSKGKFVTYRYFKLGRSLNASWSMYDSVLIPVSCLLDTQDTDTHTPNFTIS